MIDKPRKVPPFILRGQGYPGSEPVRLPPPPRTPGASVNPKGRA
jgi:hypothetical protein